MLLIKKKHLIMDIKYKKNHPGGNPDDERRKRKEAILRRKRELLDDFSDARVGLTDDERLSDYLRGMMSDEEEAEFMRRLNSDKTLRRKAVAMAYLAKAMKHVGRQRDEELKEALLSTDEYTALDILEKATLKAHGVETAASACYSFAPDGSNDGTANGSSNGEGQPAAANGEKARQPAPVSQRLHIRLVRPLAIAACVVLLGGVGYKYYKYHTAVSLGEEYCAIFPGHQSPVRGTMSETASQELATLYMNVRRGDNLDATIKRLSVLWELSQMSTYNDYTDEAPFLGWNLAIAYLKNGDKPDAKDVLTRLVRTTDKDSLVRINAVNLMKEME